MRGNRGLAFCLILALGAAAQAVTIDWVTVGDAGNAPDNTTYGDVANSYRISKYEITNSQYTEFLNAKATVGDPYALYNASMGSTYGGIGRSGAGTVGNPYVYSAKGGDANWNNRPVSYVSFWDIARFANWMNNGQGSGDTESGAYINIGDQLNFSRQTGALFFIPTEDEWYKAAYYKGGGLNAGYWDYATKSDTAPSAQAPPGTDMVNGSANYGFIGLPYYTTVVGAYTAMPSASPYGTFDQGGNLFEWNETVLSTDDPVIRGGGWTGAAFYLPATYRSAYSPSFDDTTVGFRLAGSLETTQAIPEPATVSLLGIGLAAMLRRRRRRA